MQCRAEGPRQGSPHRCSATPLSTLRRTPTPTPSLSPCCPRTCPQPGRLQSQSPTRCHRRTRGGSRHLMSLTILKRGRSSSITSSLLPEAYSSRHSLNMVSSGALVAGAVSCRACVDFRLSGRASGQSLSNTHLSVLYLAAVAGSDLCIICPDPFAPILYLLVADVPRQNTHLC